MTASRPEKRLPPGQQLVAPGKWPIIGEREPATSVPKNTLCIDGAVGAPRTWSLEELKTFPQVERIFDIHCVTRWSKLDVTFSGVLLGDLLKEVKVAPNARFLSFISNSSRRHSTSLSLDEALTHETLIAFAADGKPLTIDHGGPMRNIVPGKYFYKSVKWLCEIEVLVEDQLGYWEAESGYHNGADPWKVQRYMAATIDRRTAARLIESRDFTNQDLRSLDVGSMNLEGLIACEAILRDAKFNDCDLQNADFSRANLSNAHFQNANLNQAKFLDTDLEGCDFSGAVLSDADLSGASLIGASFCEFDGTQPVRGAQLNPHTRISEASLSQLTPAQLAYVLEKISKTG